ncbi:hypothetical protein [Planotetraspora silvatica]|uniref:hypothetical protein n=1 Tax=Planotetraspora silvatica TaxID=234614 RepID=UPI001EF16528|nr:hypothetical protein [Planotetraspora silvatica]
MVVIDCTETGASPPTGTEPTMIWRETLLEAIGWDLTEGMPRSTDISVPFALAIGRLHQFRQSSGRAERQPGVTG